jgi:ComF family protein
MSLIYPRRCETCQEVLLTHEKYICSNCLIGLPRAFNSLKKGEEIKILLSGRVPFERADFLFLFEKSGKIQQLIHAIKYENQRALAVYLGELFASEASILETYQNIDVLIPIPLHPAKLKKRGFNQSEYFAKGISQVLKKPIIENNLYRIKNTSTQTKKHKYERWENVEGIFGLSHHTELEGKHVLLLDDVITTGATIEAACEVLSAIKNIKISVACIAFANKI